MALRQRFATTTQATGSTAAGASRQQSLERQLREHFNEDGTSIAKAESPSSGEGWAGRCCKSCCSALVLSILSGVFFILLALLPGNGLTSSYPNSRNPPWSGARWRGEEQRHPSFNQWWYLMISDAETQNTYSIGFGGFRGEALAGGWMKLKPGNKSALPASVFPTVRYGWEQLHVHEDAELKVSISRPSASPSSGSAPAFLLEALGEEQVRISVDLEQEFPGARAELLLTRMYGAMGDGTLQKQGPGQPQSEECSVANIPFAYAARIEGSIFIPSVMEAPLQLSSGEEQGEGSAKGRFRAYLETTWFCSLPQPGQGAAADDAVAAAYPWKWMWGVIPAATATTTSATAASERKGSETGEIAFVMSNARMAIPLAPRALYPSLPSALASALELDVQGTFLSIDLPDRRISVANVTAMDGHPQLALPLVLAARSVQVQQGGGSSPAVKREDKQRLLSLQLQHSDWVSMEDEHGPAHIPLRQRLTAVTERLLITLSYRSRPVEYSRLPVRYLDASSKEKVCSDFRASFSDVQLQLLERGQQGQGQGQDEEEGMWNLLYQGPVPHNALEFAYHTAEYRD